MSTRRLALLMLPQVWVAYAYVTFQNAVGTVVPAASSTLEFGLLTDAVAIVAVGVAALAVNGLVAAYLLNRVATAGPPSRTRTRAPWLPGADDRSRRRHRTAGPWDRPIDPRRRQDGG